MNSLRASLTRREAIRTAMAAGLITVLPARLWADDPANVRERVTLVLVNDLDRMGDVKGRGGHAKLAAVAKAERARGNTLLIHAGDALSPSILSGFDKGFHIIEMLNRIRPDVFTPGNHDFDHGGDNFRARVEQATFDVVAANIFERDGRPVARLKPVKIVEVGKVRVGFVGVTTEETAYLSKPDDIGFKPAVEVAAEVARKLRADGADIVVAVTHIGFADDMKLVRDGAADVVLSGHDHNLVTFWNGKVALIESASQADYVTPVDLDIEITHEGGRKRVSFTPVVRPIDTRAVEPDAEIAAMIAGYEAELDKELSVVIGKTETPLDTRSSLMRSQETAFGNFVCDAMREAVAADICITNGGGVRANRQYAAGSDITRRVVLEELPFGNKTVLLEVSGKSIRETLEHGFTGDGTFPQVSGLVVRADPARPAGQRVLSVLKDGAPLADDQTYKLATNDYMARGGDGFVALKSSRVLIDALAGQYMSGHVLAYIRRSGSIAPRVEGRILLGP